MSCRTEIYSRITGFFRPTGDWNPGKKEEFKERKHFDKAIQEIGKTDKFKKNPLAYG